MTEFKWHLYIDGEWYDSCRTMQDMIDLAGSLRSIWPYSVFEYSRKYESTL